MAAAFAISFDRFLSVIPLASLRSFFRAFLADFAFGALPALAALAALPSMIEPSGVRCRDSSPFSIRLFSIRCPRWIASVSI